MIIGMNKFLFFSVLPNVITVIVIYNNYCIITAVNNILEKPHLLEVIEKIAQ